jgi:hypothetical protein
MDIGPANFPEEGLEPYGGLRLRVLFANPYRDLLFEQGGIAALHVLHRRTLGIPASEPAQCCRMATCTRKIAGATQGNGPQAGPEINIRAESGWSRRATRLSRPVTCASGHSQPLNSAFQRPLWVPRQTLGRCFMPTLDMPPGTVPARFLSIRAPHPRPTTCAHPQHSAACSL